MAGSIKGIGSVHPVDYVLFAVTIAASLGIGILAACTGGKQKTTAEYLMGNRQFKMIPVTVSMLMSYLSGITVLGNISEMYYRGAQMAMASFTTAINYAVCALLFVPLFYPLNLTSSFEYFEKRFRTNQVKKMGLFYMIISQVFYMGIAMYAPATALEAVTGFPVWASIIATGVVATIYTTIGGIKAVVWTDVLQGVIFFIGVLVVCCVATYKVGGLSQVWELSGEGGRLILFDFNPNPAMRLNFWSVVLGNIVGTMQLAGVGQTSVQRYCALPTLAKAKLSLFLICPMLVVLTILTSFAGFTIYAYYHKQGCDPLKAGFISSQNQILPYFIMDVINYPGIPGVFMAVLFSGALSSVSSSLNALSAVVWTDMLEWKYHYITEPRKVLVTKSIALIFGTLGVVSAFMVSTLGGHVGQVFSSFTSGSAGPLLGLFLVAAIFPRVNSLGTIIGSLCGFVICMTLVIGQYIYKPFPETLPLSIDGCYNVTSIRPDTVNPEGVPWIFRISFQYFSVIGCFTTILFAVIISYITGPVDSKTVPPSLLIPLCDRLCCCIPKRIRDRMCCKSDSDIAETEEEKINLKTSVMDDAILRPDNKDTMDSKPI